MDAAKPLLVAAPLLLALLWLGWRWARGRLPARPQLNALFSLLLLLYLAGTAGLGLFWVARQQLPVFDWHYLAGYTLLLLVAIHLGFNSRQLLRQLRGAARPPAQPQRRRAWLAWTGAGLLALAAYAMGRRQSPGPPPLTAGADDGGWAQLRDFHQRSAHRRGEPMPRLADWARRPPPFKQDPADWPRRSLREPALAAWSQLLWQAVGIREWQGGVAFRHAPSSGALFPVELYLLLPEGPAAGIWRVDAAQQQLVRQPGQAPAGEALIVATAVFARSGHKYGERCYRYVLADLGHLLENLLQAGPLLGRALRPLAGFDGAALAARLGLDEREEGVLAVLAPARGQPPAAAAIWRPAPPLPPTASLTARMHGAGALRAEPPAAGGVALPPGAMPAQPALLARIAARRSRRRFAARALGLEPLAALLDAVTGPGSDSLSQALRLHLLSQAVDGLSPGAWRWAPATRRLLPSARHDEALRRRSRAAALDQDVIGDAALVWVWSVAPTDLALEPLGAARAYRHALIEAGRASQRLYLAAESLGLGVCAVGAFYDEELLALLGETGLWPLHLAALGHRVD